MKISIAQINAVSGALDYNFSKIKEKLADSENLDADLLVLSGMALTGIQTCDFLKRFTFFNRSLNLYLNDIQNLSVKTSVILNYKDIDDEKYVYINKSEIKILNNFDYKFDLNGKTFKILKNINTEESLSEIDFAINISQNLSRPQSYEYLLNKMSTFAKYNKISLIYANNVGANDNYSYDGGSCILNSSGNVIVQAKKFDDDFVIFDTDKHYDEVKLSEFKPIEKFSLDYEYDMERTYKTLIQGIRDYFSKCGLRRAVLGLSGGLDSAVCAVLLADALGKENVYGISMSSKLTSSESKSDARLLAENLDIKFSEISIINIVENWKEEFSVLFDKVEKKWDNRYKESFTLDNIQARSRAMYLWGVSNEFASCIPIATSDKSEAYMGYATINGDMSGGYAPIADVTKTKLFALAGWMNKNREEKNIIPESIINKKPGAELAIDPKTGKTLIAEDALMPYEFLDEIIWRIENNHETYEQMLNSNFLYELKNDIAKEQKDEWLDKFYKRMAFAIYKWSILPPSVIVDSASINKSEYAQLITSGKIDYKTKF